MAAGAFNTVEVGPDNVDETGFFCLMSRRKADGYKRKRAWLDRRFAEGLKIHMIKDGGRGFVETIPGAYAWRAIEAKDYLVIHCLWVVGRSKGSGPSGHLMNLAVDEAKRAGFSGIAMVTSEGNWLIGRRFLDKHGFTCVEEAPPTFSLMVKRWGDVDPPSFSGNWDKKRAALGGGLTVLRSDQCPYIDDTVTMLREAADDHGLTFKEIELTSAKDVRRRAPSAYGVFHVVCDDRLISTTPITRREFDKALASSR